jgi:hypothetical protein
LQPDSLIPDPSNPQSLNRYSYVENRPVNFNDPTGHQKEKELSGFQRERQNRLGRDIEAILKKRYGWRFYGTWSYDSLISAFQTANDIEKYVDGITNGKGRDWMRAYMGGISISQTSNKRGSGLSNVGLPDFWGGSKDANYKELYLTHELAHIWDVKSADPITDHAILGGGPGDGLNTFINGTVVSENGSRWWDGSGSQYIPSGYQFKNDRLKMDGQPYANNSTADYLAETFALCVNAHHYPRSQYPLPDPSVQLYINAYISIQASQLP